MIFKEIDNMGDVGAICHYFGLTAQEMMDNAGEGTVLRAR